MIRARYLITVASVALVVTWFFLLRPAFLGGPASYVMVSGVSMEPTLYTGDLAVVRKQGSYGTGDIVAFIVPEGEPGEKAVVIHRIVGGTAEAGFFMQGDNKDAPDPWRPRPENIEGEMWFRLPGGGRVFAFLRQPLNLGIMVGGLTTFSLFGKRKLNRLRKRGRKMPPRTGKKTGGKLPASPWVMAAFAILVVLGVALTVGAIRSFRQPTEESLLVERLRYEHTAAFDYTVEMQPASLYPSGVIGPIAPPPAGARNTVTPPPIYTRLAKSLDLGFTYTLNKGPEYPDVAGELSMELQTRAGEKGWVKTQELIPPTPFDGPTASARVAIDFAQVFALIDTIEEETGFKAGTYDVSVIPTVRVKGPVGAETVDEVYAPPFTIELNRTQITLDSELARSQAKMTSETLTERQWATLFGLRMPVTMIRWLSTAGAALTLTAAAVVAAVVYLGLGRDEVGRIRARYRSRLVHVARVEYKDEVQKVRVASMRDLARLAQWEGGVIFYHKRKPNKHVYFVPDGLVTYEYVAASAAPEGEPATEEA